MQVYLWISILLGSFSAHAPGPGMWLPQQLSPSDIEAMQKEGFQLWPGRVYHPELPSLKDAVVQLGNNCTGTIVSSNGLLLTNRHCLANRIPDSLFTAGAGFWATDASREIPLQELTATLVVYMQDVTQEVLDGLQVGSSLEGEDVRELLIAQRSRAISARELTGNGRSARVVPFGKGNQYQLIVTQTFRDIRLAALPPPALNSLDEYTASPAGHKNRFSADFAVLRLYTSPNGSPASFNPQNIPYQPAYFCTPDTTYPQAGDFVFALGFPGSTDYHLPAPGIQQLENVILPAKTEAYRNLLQALPKKTDAGLTARLRKLLTTAETEAEAMKQFRVREQKTALESYVRRALPDSLQEAFDRTHVRLEELYQAQEALIRSKVLFSEVINREVILFQLAAVLNFPVNLYQNGGPAAITARRSWIADRIRHYAGRPHFPDDQEVFSRLMESYFQELPYAHLSPYAIEHFTYAQKDPVQFGKRLYRKSLLAQPELMLQLLEEDPEKFIAAVDLDVGFRLARRMVDHHRQYVLDPLDSLQVLIGAYRTDYEQYLQRAMPAAYFPDANGTLRLSFGKVAGFRTLDGETAPAVFSLADWQRLAAPGKVPAEVAWLQASDPLGRDSTSLPLVFAASLHTTGGSSGSPVLNARGKLIGINFDRNPEGMVSDWYFEPESSRNMSISLAFIERVGRHYAPSAAWLAEVFGP